ncbi:Spy/CpxP family protein refolding chaperone [Novosphingobium terrae]|uniref:Spy/CpxP family protein refolding chaperone n=1 Tax=Novosphingobium terrae TaxID=2726189 RepID=UPI00197F15B7|nr:Spy/CpxP family protein refolding chaperone [Novosphingobium terrae]
MIKNGAIALALGAAVLSAAPGWSQTVGLTPEQKLHDYLHLTPQQELGWEAYRAQASAPNRTQERRRSAAALFPNISAPQRMDLMEAEMRQEQADLHKQAQALKTFYTTLSPEQQKVFDTQTLPPAQPAKAP